MTDLPVALFYRQLFQKYPEAKCIHTTRDEDGWLASMEWLLTKGIVERGWTSGPLLDEMHYAIYGTVRFDRELLLASFRRHEEQVNDFFSTRPQNLLVLNISKGELSFDTICPFLGIEAPDTPFPVSNAKD